MNGSAPMPAAARHLAGFPSFLRRFDFRTSPEQTMAFLEAVELLGPRSIDDVRRAALATLSPARERAGEFDALFRAWFHGEFAPVPGEREDETEIRIHEEAAGVYEPSEAPDVDESGRSATAAEALSQRRFRPEFDLLLFRRFAREAPVRLPRRRGFRHARARKGESIDLRRALRLAVRQGGDTPVLPWRRRRPQHRRILLLIDISGSMKEHTEHTLRFAHALHRAAERMECFTLGTRLTRVTGAFRLRNPDRALERASALAPDWDGGTRIGDALRAFLAVPRFAGLARGAAVIILSDGLERGAPDAMIDAVRRLSRLAWRLSWLTPLAADAGFRPETAALAAVLPWLDDLEDGATPARLCAHVLGLGRVRGRGSDVQRQPLRGVTPGTARGRAAGSRSR